MRMAPSAASTCVSAAGGSDTIAPITAIGETLLMPTIDIPGYDPTTAEGTTRDGPRRGADDSSPGQRDDPGRTGREGRVTQAAPSFYVNGLRAPDAETLEVLARALGVTTQSLPFGLMRQDQRTRICQRFGMLGYRKVEPGSDELPPESPSLATAIHEAPAKGLDAEEVAAIAGFASSADNRFYQGAGPRLRVLQSPGQPVAWTGARVLVVS